MILKTYDRQLPWEPEGAKAIVKLNKLLRTFIRPKPGEWVTHKDYGGFGVLVAIADDQCTVLWSKTPEPGLNLKYNPLAMDEDIYIPVRCNPHDGNNWCPIVNCKCGRR